MTGLLSHGGVRDLPPDTLTSRPENARTHSPKQLERLRASIARFGFLNPILIDGERRVIAGHARLEAAKRLGLEVVPTLAIEGLSEGDLRLFAIAENRIAELAGWDKRLLAHELRFITELEIDVDLTLSGFEAAEIEILFDGLDPGTSDEADWRPAIDRTAPPVSRAGDLWQLGRHRLLCADATRDDSYARLLGGKKAQLVFIDPPYNVPIDGHVSGLGQTRHADFVMASGEMSEVEFIAFLSTVLKHLVAHTVDGAIHYVCMDWRHLHELLSAARGVYSETKNLCVWNKTNAGMGSLYRSKHELVLVFKSGRAPHVNNIELGRHGRYRTNVWDYAGVNTFRVGREDELALHPTVKPVALVADAIRDCSRRRGLVLDGFAGSGTTLLAAEQTGRVGYAMELDPTYVDAAIARFAAVTGEAAVHVASGLGFEALRQQRQAEPRHPATPGAEVRHAA